MINYPNKKETFKKVTFDNNSNKGMGFEDMINKSNEYYLLNEVCYVNKRPTSIKVLKTSDRYHIEQAVFVTPSTLDYVGTYKGKYLDFEAKETINEKGFPTANIAKHQLESIKNVLKFQGICFVLINMRHFKEIYFVDGNDILEMCLNHKTNIPYSELKEKGTLIKEGYNVPVDYIKVVENRYFKDQK